jgi:hypothetical protein
MKQNSELDVIHWEKLLKLVSYMKKLWRWESLFEIIKTKAPHIGVGLLFPHSLVTRASPYIQNTWGENS